MDNASTTPKDDATSILRGRWGSRTPDLRLV